MVTNNRRAEFKHTIYIPEWDQLDLVAREFFPQFAGNPSGLLRALVREKLEILRMENSSTIEQMSQHRSENGAQEFNPSGL